MGQDIKNGLGGPTFDLILDKIKTISQSNTFYVLVQLHCLDAKAQRFTKGTQQFYRDQLGFFWMVQE